MHKALGIVLGLGVPALLSLPLLLSRAHGQPQPAAPPPVVVGGQAPGGRALMRMQPLVRGALPGLQGALQAADGSDSEGEFTDAITLPTDRQAKKRLEAAEDCIEDEDWGNAAGLLQLLLDAQEDVFIQVRRKDVSGRETMHWTSVRAEANRLIESMPSKGLQFYELQYGPRAKALLADARTKSDPHTLAEVAQRFLHTEAGALATDLLGTYHLDRGRHLMAALCFKRLLGRLDTQRVSPLLLLKATLAFRHAGEAALAEQSWKQLTAKVGREGLRLDDQTVSLNQLRNTLESQYPLQLVAATNDWPLFRGQPSRSEFGRGSGPFLLRRAWQKSILPENTATHQYIEDALTRADDRLPASFPIAVGGKLIYRTYAGIESVAIESGKLVWESRSNISFDAIMGQETNTAKRKVVEEWFKRYKEGNNLNLLFENSTLGTLSADRSRVYAVDDLLLPPHPILFTTAAMGWNGSPPMTFGALQEAVQQSRLMAFDLATEGKVVWIKGDARDTSELAGSYFLGPPLPLGGKLYVLTEKNSELRLACLDAQRGDVLWTQKLASAKDRLLTDVGRRIQAVHLAYGDGILVCPTNAGAILGVDLLSRSLLWAHPYREGGARPTTPPIAPFQAFRGGRPVIVPQNRLAAQYLSTSDWKVSAPVVQEGKVVFTAPDGASVHCLNLRDGDLLWKEERRDDLYLAGVFDGKVLLVGKNACRALSLNEGKPLWRVETGVPSGQGMASGSYYYLPLKKGEVCRIDLSSGRLEHGPSAPAGEAPGNLIFCDGMVISQTETAVSAYGQLDTLLARSEEDLKKNPRDPQALLRRGELRLYQADLAGAAADLRQALANQPPTEVVAKTRARLYETLTELLQRDWKAGAQYLDEYKQLCAIPIPPDATADERRALEEEQQQRNERYLHLLAKGREQEGRLVEAFSAYLDYSALASSRAQVSVLDEPFLKTQPNLWVQGRIAALLARATPEQRRALEAEVRQRWHTVQDSGDLHSLNHFVAVFGSLVDVGREARLLLAEQLAEDKHYLEAELHLLQLIRVRDNATLTAQALEGLARLMTRKGLLEDAIHYYRVLNRDFAKTIVHDGKTGAELFHDLASDKRFLLYLDEQVTPTQVGNLKVKEIPGQNSMLSRALAFIPQGEALPFFQRHRLELTQLLSSNTYQLSLRDRETGEERWSQTLTRGGTSTPLNTLYDVRIPYHLNGHLVVFQLGSVIYAFDMLERKKLWDRNLLGQETLSPQYQSLIMDEDGDLVLLNTVQGTRQRLGRLGPVTPSYVCLKTREGLLGLDPVRGTVLWTKNDVSMHTHIFGDARHVFLVEVRDGQVATWRALRGQDGASVAVPDFSSAFKDRVHVLGGRLLVSSKDETTAQLTLRIYDVHSGKDLWKRSFPPQSVRLSSEDNLAGMVEPDGKLTIVDLDTCVEVLRAEVKPQHLTNVDSGFILQDRGDYYVVFNQPQANANAQRPWANLMQGLRSAPVNGMVYAFRQDTGELHWRTTEPIQNQEILLDHFDDLPMLVFTASRSVPGLNQPVSRTLSIDKRTGKFLSDRPSNPNAQQFHTLRINRAAGTFDLISLTMTLRHYVDRAETAKQMTNDQ